MNQTQHMVMKACEELMEAGGSAKGIDRALLDNLIAVCEVEVREQREAAGVDALMADIRAGRFVELDKQLEGVPF